MAAQFFRIVPLFLLLFSETNLMPTTINSAGITFNDATTLTSAVIPANAVGATQLVNGSVTAAKLGTTEQTRIAKAWVNFNGTTSPGTIRSSYNVSSVTKNGTGDYTVNFATAMADANYSVSLTTVSNSATDCGRIAAIKGVATTGPSNKTTSAISIIFGSTSGSLQDLADINMSIFGN